MSVTDKNSKGQDSRSLPPLDGTKTLTSRSRLPGFYELPISERVHALGKFADLTQEEREILTRGHNLSPQLLDVFIENAVGTFELPLGIATNFKINNRDYLIPMAVEETSVLAAASHGAKLALHGGGFIAESTDPIMTGQIQLFLNRDKKIEAQLLQHKDSLIAFANQGHRSLVERGGGAVDMSWHWLDSIDSLVIHLHINTKDAMGANIVNTMCEKLSGPIAKLFYNCDVGLRILTNLNDRRRTKVSCNIPAEAFDSPEYAGKEVIQRIVMAYEFADADIYRATTNNKGVMNGIDPVVIATGNDWRAIEAGCHAFAAQSGRYKPLAKWSLGPDAGSLKGEMEIPMAVGTVGGVTKLHPTAKLALKLLGNPTATELGQIICAVGLAQNLSALRALASEGIQKGHMSLHQRNLDLLGNRK